MQLEIKERSVGDVVILELQGRITIGEGSVQLRDVVSGLLTNNRQRMKLMITATKANNCAATSSSQRLD